MNRTRLLVLLTVPALLAAALSGLPARAASSSAGTQSTEQLVRIGKVTVRNLPTTRGPATPGAHEISKGVDFEKEAAAAPPSTLSPPTPANTPVTESTTGFSGFAGITHQDQRLAGGGNQFSLEPPDQGLCVGNGYVFESVNDALRIYNTSGTALTGAITQSQFYGLPPTINRTTGVFGPFLSDPKCYFDPDTGHWFHTILEIDQNPQTGAFVNKAATLLAVSTSGNPLGSWNLFSISAVDPNHPNCPCFGDQPLIGADQYGFYISTAEYQLHNPFGAHFNGPQIYAMSKTALEAGSLPTVVHFSGLGDRSGTVQPATSPSSTYNTSNGGTEFFMSGYDTLPPDGRLRPGQYNKMDVWGLTNTSSLTGSPALTLSFTTLTTETYGQPPTQTQKNGTRPLGSSLGEGNPQITSNDDRMNQVVYADGMLWAGINTIIGGEAAPRTGIAWFIVTPQIPITNSTIYQQGYIAVAKSFVSFPSIGVNDSGQGAVVFTLMSRKDFPSFAYAPISLAGLGSSVYLAEAGALPEDGFSCYPEFAGGGVCRWGDYSAAVAEGSTIWMATEYIPDAPRTVNANWGTFVGRLAP